jgi:hypothetical protein
MIIITRLNWSRESMAELLDSIHDRWFDLGRVRLDKPGGEVTLCIGDTKHGPFERQLVFSRVTSLAIEDNARIQLYDIEGLSVDVPNGRIVLQSGFPLKLTMDVADDWSIRCDVPEEAS